MKTIGVTSTEVLSPIIIQAIDTYKHHIPQIRTGLFFPVLQNSVSEKFVNKTAIAKIAILLPAPSNPINNLFIAGCNIRYDRKKRLTKLLIVIEFIYIKVTR